MRRFSSPIQVINRCANAYVSNACPARVQTCPQGAAATVMRLSQAARCQKASRSEKEVKKVQNGEMPCALRYSAAGLAGHQRTRRKSI